MRRIGNLAIYVRLRLVRWATFSPKGARGDDTNEHPDQRANDGAKQPPDRAAQCGTQQKANTNPSFVRIFNAHGGWAPGSSGREKVSCSKTLASSSVPLSATELHQVEKRR